MDAYHLDLASANDAAAIASLSQRVIECGLAPSWPPDRILCHIKRTDSVVLTGRFQDQLVGFAIMMFGQTSAHLNLLAVESDHQGKGLGHGLMNWLHESARVAGTFTVTLELRANNIDAKRFYESLGYCAGAVTRGYYQGIEDALRMACDLRVDRSLTA